MYPPISLLLDRWATSLENRLVPASVNEYWRVGRAWERRWKTLDAITERNISEWQDELLGRVVRETAKKHCVYLRRFLSWCSRSLDGYVAPIVPQLDSMASGRRSRDEREAVVLEPGEVAKLLSALPERSPGNIAGQKTYAVRDYYVVLWETGLRPHSTVEMLSAPRHYTPGSDHVMITADIDKARNATRGRKGKASRVFISAAASYALTRQANSETVFGETIFGNHHEHRSRILRRVSRAVLGKEVRDYDFKHSRITAWFAEGKNPMGISYATGVALDTLISHYAHPGEAAGRSMVR